jgi:uncharacterized protein YndB with AHSA1/START domain
MRSDSVRDGDGISIRRVLNAPCKQVFEAWTRPELMARWFFAGEGWTTKVSADVRVGGRYELTMRDTSGEEHAQFGEYREIVPVTRLVFTWSFAPLAVVDSVVTVELVDLGATTELNLTHVLPPDPKIRRSHEDGWTGCLRNLDLFINQEPRELKGEPT